MSGPVYTGHRLSQLIAERTGQPSLAHDAEVVACALPFKVSTHVVDELIDWGRAPDDPLYRLVMPHRDMLAPADFASLEAALKEGKAEVAAIVKALRDRLNPHPGGQLELNVPDGGWGLQHKYSETLLVFPRQGQTCHSYCAYCFRWPQFTGDPDLRQALSGPEVMTAHLDRHPEITDILLTGGDPLVMRTELLRHYIDPLLTPGRRDQIRTIRIGTKAVSFSPDRFLNAADADDLMRLFEQIVAAGCHLALMLHVSHPRELHPEPARRALRRLRDTGAVLRTQAPVIRHVNDNAACWARMWQEQVELGIVPYYMFVERDTGPHRYFGLPLARALTIYNDSIRHVSGLARTARGPVMSTEIGKLLIDGVTHLPEGPAFALRALQARNPDLVGHIAHARFDPTAEWWTDLTPYTAHDHTLLPHQPPVPSTLPSTL
ncbi:KamA family radical SAM protein [Streptomyces huasconensis]|uniref:KamA family radical SAM protein n=1 Tax=Streptomyces huasconensis TaxID=1854574 RepID=UPI0033DF8A8B